MSKELQFSTEARASLLRGVEVLARSVKATLGPKGRNVMIAQAYGSPRVTKDGVSVAKEVSLKDPFENAGAQMVREVASKTNDIAGDGTTTSTVLAEAIFREGMKLVAAGHDPMTLKRGMDAAVETVVANLRDASRAVTNTTEILQVGSISANGDAEIGRYIAEAMDRVGKDGVVLVEEASGIDTELDVVEGFRFDRGYLSPYFVTDTESASAVLENPLIFLHDRKISSVQQILPAVETAARNQRPIVLIAEDFEGDTLPTLVMNHLRGTIRVVAIKAPGYGDGRRESLLDIAAATGATLLSDATGNPLSSLSGEHLGTASRIVVTKDHTTIVEGAGDEGVVESRKSLIRSQLATATSDFEREKLQERLAKLADGIAVIRIGAATETEMKERKDRVEDALNATRAAVEEGIVPGGGVALARAAAQVDPESFGDLSYGVRIILQACRYPMHTIAQNAGVSGDIVLSKVLESSDPVYGYNAATGVYGDMIEQGVVDPVKVTRVALQNASSIASMLLTTEVVIVDEEKPEPSM